jgi:hypothetical protein
VSEFDSSAEGWTVSVRASGNAFMTEVGSYQPDWLPTGGDPGGCISEVDPDSNWSFLRAPALFLGDQSAQSGRELRFSIRTTRLELAEGRLVILIGPGGLAISQFTPVPTLNQWTRQRVSLSAGLWKASSNGTGSDADQARIDAVLAGLDTLLIGMEYGSDALEEVVSLDSVYFGVCNADLAPPFGTLNFFDVSAFLGLYNAQDPAADLAPPFGQWNFFDVSEFLAGYNAGCL